MGGLAAHKVLNMKVDKNIQVSNHLSKDAFEMADTLNNIVDVIFMSEQVDEKESNWYLESEKATPAEIKRNLTDLKDALDNLLPLLK